MRHPLATTKYQRKRILRSIVTILASIVVFVTTYALIIPAITWEKTLICELEEHVHTDNCYNSKGELKCGKTEHKHTDACYDAPKAVDPIYICGRTQHKHTEDCYFDDGTLKCTIPEHTHTTACLYANRVALTARTFLSSTPTTNPYCSDPDTSDLLNLFKVNGAFTADNDGKVTVDKTVSTITGSTDEFKVWLSALGQSYVKNTSVDEVIHPDIVFVVDISSSMNTDTGLDIDKSTPGNQTRFAAVADCLNYAIGEMLKADPESRVGIVSYSEVVMDGTVPNSDRYRDDYGTYYDYGGTGLYLPLDKYNYRSDGKYVVMSGSGAAGSENDWQLIGINTNLTNKNGTHMNAYLTKGLHGTNTQMGLLGGLRMFQEAKNKENREPVLILITDGEPRSANQSVDGKNTSSTSKLGSNNDTLKSDLFQHSWHEIGYWTIRTAIDVKNQITNLYKTANIGKENEMFFYTMGPGVTSLYGKTILDPSTANLELCKNANDSGGNYSAYDLYNALINGQSARAGHSNTAALPKLTEEERKYSDFADWSLSGELTPQELEEGMAIIIANMKKIPRPINTPQAEPHYNIIDTGSILTFTDTVGKDMTVTETPKLVYGDKTFTAEVRETGTLSSDNRYTSEFAGQPYTLYRFSSDDLIRETSTGKSLDISRILLYKIEKTDGSTVIMWQFPDELLPVIYHNPGGDSISGTSDDTFVPTDPLRIEFTVAPADSNLTPGEVYYSNSTDNPTTASFQIADDNPYYNENTGGTADNPVYSPNNTDSSTNKSVNRTETRETSSEYDQTDLNMNVILGNNGRLITPFRLEVLKKWADNLTSHDPITITLYANGEPTHFSVELSESNGWKGTFEDDNLQVVDSTGKKIIYTVREEEVPTGYTVTGEKVAPHWITITPSEYWKAVTGELEAGKIYRIHFGNSVADDVLFGGSGTLSIKNPSGNTTTKGEQWEVVNETDSNNRTGLRLKNVASGKYLSINSSYSLSYQDSINGTTVTIPSGYSLIRLIKWNNSTSTNYYLKNDNGTVKAVTGHSNGTAVTLEVLVTGSNASSGGSQSSGTQSSGGSTSGWTAVNAFEEGGTYRIRVDSATGNVLRDSNNQLTVGTASGSTTDMSEQWTVVDGYLKNVNTNKYIAFDPSQYNTFVYGLNVSGSNYIPVTYSSQKLTPLNHNDPTNSANSLYAIANSGGDYRFLRYSNGSFSWVGDWETANLTKFYLEKLDGSQTSQTEPVEPGDIGEKEIVGYGFELTNKPLELTIEAKKEWGDGTAGFEAPVTLTVYEKTTSGTVSVIGTMTLNSSNGWKNEFIPSTTTSTSTYYVAETRPTGFVIGYTGGAVESITYDGNTIRAVKVDPQHGAVITVTNVRSNGEKLPATGGSGTHVIYIISALIIVGAMTIGHISRRRREGRGEE